jgi:hypothetical protein
MTQAKTPQPPKLNHRFACVADRDAVTLAAVVSSYLYVPGTYLPLFLLRKAEIARTEEDFGFLSDAYVAELMVGQDAVFIANALGRMGRPEYVILAGLSEAQKSYLILPPGVAVIEIADLAQVESKLLPLTPAKDALQCRSEDALRGLIVAHRHRKRLVLHPGAPQLPEIVQPATSAVVVELLEDAGTVVAINYSNSIDASVLLVDALDKDQARQVQNWMQDWKEKHETQPYQKLKQEVERRIGGISFQQFDYVTFFTSGLPYSLILEDIIPCTYVHLMLKPDLFVLNSILFRDGERFGAAVVFSPVFFPDEETSWLCDFLLRNKYYLRPLIAQNASLAAFDFHAQRFPYDLLHICSHGGEVEGYEMTEEFTDRDGKAHRVEFEEVVGFTPAPDNPGMVSVHRKVFPRTLDGLRWMSPELKQHGLPSHVSLAMWKSMLQCEGVRRPKGRVALSCAIACADSIHQGQFDELASYSSPIVFNNTCWSWSEVAAFFLACGARAYIGTLWNIDNDAAVLAARTFYENLLSGTVLSAFHKAVKSIDGTPSKGVYIYWGLPFTTLPPGNGHERAQNKVRKELMRAVESWVRKIESTKNAEVRRSCLRVVRLLVRELLTHFPSADSTELERTVQNRVPDFRRATIPADSEEPSEPGARRSLERPLELRQVHQTLEPEADSHRSKFPSEFSRT